MFRLLPVSLFRLQLQQSTAIRGTCSWQEHRRRASSAAAAAGLIFWGVGVFSFNSMVFCLSAADSAKIHRAKPPIIGRL